MTGEPSGTAGGAIFNVLKKRELVNCLIIVTRYFGGILLGTGGLTRAYQDSSISAIDEAQEIEKEKGCIADIVVSYDREREFEYMCEKESINILSKEYGENIKNNIEISEEKFVEIFRKNKTKSWEDFKVLVTQNKFIEKSK